MIQSFAAAHAHKRRQGLGEDDAMENRTEPKTLGHWIRYIAMAAIALFLVWWMLRVYVLG
ncbi:MAG: hypothetical protein ACREA1_00655 [Nitrosotalea sp.]